MVMATSVTASDALARRACRKLGLPPLAVVEVRDRKSGASKWVRLAGSLEDLYVTRSRASETEVFEAASEAELESSSHETDFDSVE
jgi:hypothetical protein